MKTFLNTCAIAALGVALLGCATDPSPSILPNSSAAEAGVLPMPADLEAALRQAQIQRRNKDYEHAQQTLSQLVLVAPDDPRVIGEYGKVLTGQGRSDDAVAFLTRATQLKQNDWTLFSALGVAYDQKGDYKSAQAAYARALSLRPNEASVLSNAAMSHLQQGDTATARNLLLQAQKAGGTDPRIARNLAFVDQIAPVAARPAATAAVRPAAQPAKPVTTTASTASRPATTAAAPAPTRTASATAPAKPTTVPATRPASAAPAKPATQTATSAPTTLRRSD